MAAGVDTQNDPYFYDRLFCMLFRFKYIKRNKFAGSSESLMNANILSVYYANDANGPGPSCLCKSVGGLKCGDRCTLRLFKLECSTSCGSECRNQTLTLGVFLANLKITVVDGYGICIVPKATIEKDVPISEYVGKVTYGQVKINQMFCYPIRLFHSLTPMYICQRKQGNASRFLQHSVRPNCEIQEWVVGKEVRLLVVAKKRILPEEVLTISFLQRGCDEKNEWKFLPQEDDEEECTFQETSLGEILYSRLRAIIPRMEGSLKCIFPGCKFHCRTQKEMTEHFQKKHVPEELISAWTGPPQADGNGDNDNRPPPTRPRRGRGKN